MEIGQVVRVTVSGGCGPLMKTVHVLLVAVGLVGLCWGMRSSAGDFSSGEVHATRIPHDHWGHRLQMAKALGLSTVSTYVFWSQHEPESGMFDWSGENDIAEFCRLAQREGLQVLIRPGPYVCGEYDFGGLPWWLLKDRDMRVRSRHPTYLNAVRRYYKALGEQLAPLQVTRGGPIAMVQVENEYDGHGRDDGYIEALAAALRESGFDVPLYTSEMTWALRPSRPKTSE